MDTKTQFTCKCVSSFSLVEVLEALCVLSVCSGYFSGLFAKVSFRFSERGRPRRTAVSCDVSELKFRFRDTNKPDKTTGHARPFVKLHTGP